MTAANLCKGLNYSNPITTNYLFSEYQENKTQYGNENQIPQLLSKNMAYDEFKTKFMKGVDFTDNPEY